MDNTKAIAERLYLAEKSATPIDPLTVTYPDFTPEQGLCDSARRSGDSVRAGFAKGGRQEDRPYLNCHAEADRCG